MSRLPEIDHARRLQLGFDEPLPSEIDNLPIGLKGVVRQVLREHPIPWSVDDYAIALGRAAARAADRAILTERERCARQVETGEGWIKSNHHDGVFTSIIAAAIRKGTAA